MAAAFARIMMNDAAKYFSLLKCEKVDKNFNNW